MTICLAFATNCGYYLWLIINVSVTIILFSLHGVQQVYQPTYESCDLRDGYLREWAPIQMGGSVTVVLNAGGVYYFVDSVGDNCLHGNKMKVSRKAWKRYIHTIMYVLAYFIRLIWCNGMCRGQKCTKNPFMVICCFRNIAYMLLFLLHPQLLHNLLSISSCAGMHV